MGKALTPQVWRLVCVGGERGCPSDERRLREGAGGGAGQRGKWETAC